MSIYYNNSDALYITAQALNSSQTNSNTVICKLDQQTNPIVSNLSEYDIFVQSITCSTAELPYFNIYRQIAWNPNNFENNCTNMTISILADVGTPFDLTTNLNPLVVGCGNTNGLGNWQGVTAYLQFISENTTLQNDGNSANNPISYFAVHSIQQFIDMINNALIAISLVDNGGLFVNNANQYYFYYDPITQLYNFFAPNTFPAAQFNMYVNSYLEYRLDNFRWVYIQNSTVVAPPLIIDDLNSPYSGLDNMFVKKNYPNNLSNNIYTYAAEYVALSNLVDIHSLLVVADSGQLQSVRQQIIPANTNNNTSALNLPTIACLKSLDIELNGLNIASLNNTYIQYESPGLFYPINSLINNEFTNISLSIYLQDIDNTIYPLMLPAGGYCNIKFVLKKKNVIKK